MVIIICESENTVTLDSGSTEEHYWYSRMEHTNEAICFYRGRSINPFMTIPINYGVIVYEDEE